MRIDILSIFPSFFNSFLDESLLKKAIDKGLLEVNVHDLRSFTEDKHKRVDDIPYGGGAGMVLMPKPLIKAITKMRSDSPKARTILLSPRGKTFGQKYARRLAKEEGLILLCGRYEGFDERVSKHVDEEVCIGDFILNGGEVAAMAVMESVFRLLPGAIGSEESLEAESFENGLLEYPQYTRPEEFEGDKVPDVLLSGHHKKIEQWRAQRSLKKTIEVRPDLLAKKAREQGVTVDFSIALIHHPVLGKSGTAITGSVTTIDVHDFARLGKTYDAKSVFIVTPVEDQKKLVERLKGHWMGGDLIKGEFERRVEALDIVETVNSVEEMIGRVKKRSKKVKILVTSAIDSDDAISPEEWIIRSDEADEWIIFYGTAYGLAPELMDMADYRLSPIAGRGEFNHLPVRGASAIITDRLFGNRGVRRK